MSQATLATTGIESSAATDGHAIWVRLCHWIVAASFVILAITGYVILMAHPRLYWGDVGNELTPAILELPISGNYRPESWQQTVTFSDVENTPISANRTYQIFNQNSWGRSLHFLAGWFFVVAGAIYALSSLFTGHIKRNLLPRARELSPAALWQDFKNHIGLKLEPATGGPPYGLLQKCTYVFVGFIALPFMVLTGLTMSPTVTAAYPILLSIFGGHQSARTLHFFGFALLILFFLVHVAMVMLTGFRRQMRAMTLGN